MTNLVSQYNRTGEALDYGHVSKKMKQISLTSFFGASQPKFPATASEGQTISPLKSYEENSFSETKSLFQSPFLKPSRKEQSPVLKKNLNIIKVHKRKSRSFDENSENFTSTSVQKDEITVGIEEDIFSKTSFELDSSIDILVRKPSTVMKTEKCTERNHNLTSSGCLIPKENTENGESESDKKDFKSTQTSHSSEPSVGIKNSSFHIKNPSSSLNLGKTNLPVVVNLNNDQIIEKVSVANKKAKAIKHPPQICVPLSAYELERLERIRKNQEYLISLGIQQGAKSSISEKKKISSKKKSNENRVQTLPVRRSSRIRGIVEGGDQTDKEIGKLDGTHIEGGIVVEGGTDSVFYDDSSVLKYMCEENSSKDGSTEGFIWSPAGMEQTVAVAVGGVDGVDEKENLERTLAGFKVVQGFLQDSALSKIYSMDIARRNRSLLAAGGHQGRIAVFPFENQTEECGTSHSESQYGAESHMGMEEDSSVQPLVSWKAGRGWISQVQFLSEQFMEEATLLLSSSNDHSVVLWDLNKQQHQARANQSTTPKIVAQADHLHAQGIFGMHEKSLRLATASKDRTLAYGRIGPTGFTKERTIENHHSAAVRGVRFRDLNILADCGADARICILDLRIPTPCMHTLQDAHASEINVVEWSPTNENLFLSASHDPQILIHDIRSLAQPLHRLSGHMSPQIVRSRQIYRPAFVWAGKGVVTPGEGSGKLSLYNVETGKAISRGCVGHDSLSLMVDRTSGGGSHLWLAGKTVVQLSPIWKK